MNYSISSGAVTAAAVFMLCCFHQQPAHADDTWIVRVRGIVVDPQDDSTVVSVNGSEVAGSGVGVNTDVVPELDITYKFAQNWGVELILATSQHDVDGQGTLAAVGEVIDSMVLPPTLTLQYHFDPVGRLYPYLGVGVNYTLFYDEEVTGGLSAPGATVDVEPSWGYALQVGADWNVQGNWYANVDLKYIDIDTTANFLNTAVGAASVDVDIDPLVIGFGVGYRF